MSEVIRGGAQAQSEATSETPKFTPGPWLFEPHGLFGSDFMDEVWPFGYLSHGPYNPSPIFELRTVYEIKTAELEANAHLIAAAPDLYRALKAAMAFIDSHVADYDITDEMCRTYAALQEANPRAALRKAEGGE